MEDTKIQVLSVLQLLGHPRDSKRIDMLCTEGFSVRAVAFERKYHTGRMPPCPTEVLGLIAHGNYLARIVTMLVALPKLRNAIRQCDVVYASGMDMGLFARLAGIFIDRVLVVETGDVRNPQVKAGLIGRLVRWVDRIYTNSCDLLVVTAPDFLDVYYRKWLGVKTPALVLENKLEESFVSNNPPDDSNTPPVAASISKKIRIGYFGLLRCEWSWAVLKELAVAHGSRFDIVLAGYPMGLDDIDAFAASHENVSYFGEYKSPEDLSGLYGSVDIVWACYKPIEEDDWNLKWARPNRFYESCHFRKPLISRAGSNDAKEVQNLGLGITIDESDISKTADKLASITTEQLEEWTHNVSALPKKHYMYTTESSELAALIRSALESGKSHKRVTNSDA